ncbi:MAG: EAL domain-containing protein [Thiotrichaceae bacterium]|nr:EAL domain-containing protein [Thiotrichaceae bacterium]
MLLLELLKDLYFRFSGRKEAVILSMQKSLNVVRDAVILVDRSGIILFLNRNAEELLQCEQRSVLGKCFWSLYSIRDDKTHRPVTDLLNNIQSNVSGDYVLVATDHELLTNILISPINFLYKKSNDHSYALVINDISEKRMLESKVSFLENYDALTRLTNRHAMELTLKHALTDVKKHSATHVFCYISLDKLKNVTDAAGHSAGDALVKKVSIIIKDFITRKRNILSRVGYEDFAILFREEEPNVALTLTHKIRQAIEKFEFTWHEDKFNVTASVGFLLVHEKYSTSPSQVISDADIASRIARDKGGNRINIFSATDEAVLARKSNLSWVGRIRSAIKDNKFELYAQPIHPLAVNEAKQPFYHYETLIRLFEDGVQISPIEFLPSAEQQGLMLEIDQWVVKEALKHLANVKQTKPLPVFSINLSGQSVNEVSFLNTVLQIVKNSGVNPKMICFEITETVAANDIKLVMNFIKTLKAVGCSFSLDDFGTGISSYEYLRELPVDYLKIDGVFVKNLETDTISQEMIRSINQVGHVMGLKVIAEYVENDEIIRILQDIGVDYGQGYGISRPLPIITAVESLQGTQ